MGTEPESDPEQKGVVSDAPDTHLHERAADSLHAYGADDEAIIPKGALDPVYEAKARVLNRAVRAPVNPHVLPPVNVS
jgi:hypothetical protein